MFVYCATKGSSYTNILDVFLSCNKLYLVVCTVAYLKQNLMLKAVYNLIKSKFEVELFYLMNSKVEFSLNITYFLNKASRRSMSNRSRIICTKRFHRLNKLSNLITENCKNELKLV